MSEADIRAAIEGSIELTAPTKVAGNGKIETPEWPDVTEEGDPKRTYSNARAAITALGVACSYDVFHDRMLVAGHPINEWAGELSDAVNVMLRQIIIDQFGFDPGKDNISDAATELCLENRFDPIVDYLAGLKWDGTPRLDQWLTTYLGAEDLDLNQAIGRLTLVAAVRRARKPGSKFDHILTLEGVEGTMKSTSIVTLAGIENFSDQTILTASDKEQQELVRGTWIFEIADLAGMRRAEVEKIKAFASRTHDRARPAYGRRRVDAPRRCIFIATTNEDEYLQSQTGNRRFWPVKTGHHRHRSACAGTAISCGPRLPTSRPRASRWCCRKTYGAMRVTPRTSAASMIHGMTSSRMCRAYSTRPRTERVRRNGSR